MFVLKKALSSVVFLSLLMCAPSTVYSNQSNEKIIESDVRSNSIDVSASKLRKKHKKLLYYLNVDDFIKSFIQIPTSNVAVDSSTISSTYLAGRAPLYDKHGAKVGTCSASFLCMQNADGIYTDISNYLSVDNGLVISWFTPTTLINLELDSIVHSMVTECIVDASTKIGFNPYYGQVFNMIVSSQEGKILFELTKL